MSDAEIQTLMRIGSYAGGLRLLAKILQRYGIEFGQHFELQLTPERPDHFEADP
jgi:hypothetical protein